MESVQLGGHQVRVLEEVVTERKGGRALLRHNIIYALLILQWNKLKTGKWPMEIHTGKPRQKHGKMIIYSEIQFPVRNK